MKSKQDALALVVLALVLLVPLRGFAQAGGDPWRFSVTPYLWLPGIDGTLRYGPPPPGGGTANVSVDDDLLDWTFMFAAEARRGRWSIATDFIYLSLSSDRSRIRSVDFNPGSGPVNVTNTALNLGTEVKFKGSIWTLVGGYSVVQDPRATLDVIGGFRYADLETTTNYQLSATITGPAGAATFARTGSLTKDEHIWDAIVGIRGQVKLGQGNWFVPYHFDVGAGDSDLTWQGVAGIGYAFKWVELRLLYRHLSYEQGGNKLFKDLTLSGPAFGATFRF